MNGHAKRFLWMSDENAQKVLNRGFWSGLLYMGLLRFGLGGVVFLTMVGVIWNGPQAFDMAWWRKGSVGFLLGGLIGFASLWLLAKLPLLWREVICWTLAAVIIAFVGFLLLQAPRS